jgi:hypothetical protein
MVLITNERVTGVNLNQQTSLGGGPHKWKQHQSCPKRMPSVWPFSSKSAQQQLRLRAVEGHGFKRLHRGQRAVKNNEHQPCRAWYDMIPIIRG